MTYTFFHTVNDIWIVKIILQIIPFWYQNGQMKAIFITFIFWWFICIFSCIYVFHYTWIYILYGIQISKQGSGIEIAHIAGVTEAPHYNRSAKQ